MGLARALPRLSSRLLAGPIRRRRAAPEAVAAAEDRRAHDAMAAALVQVSHDLRGALSPALLIADALREHNDPAVARAGDSVVLVVDRATALALELLALARDGAPRDRGKTDGYQP